MSAVWASIFANKTVWTQLDPTHAAAILATAWNLMDSPVVVCVHYYNIMQCHDIIISWVPHLGPYIFSAVVPLCYSLASS